MVRCRRLGTEEFWNLGAAVSRDRFGWVGYPLREAWEVQVQENYCTLDDIVS